MFENRNLLIVGKHKKETVIAPIFEKLLEVKCFTNTNFDTDEFGTFSGEIERESDPLSTVRNKCLAAMEFSKCNLAIASEGSFGPHPSIFFAKANEEFLIIIDKKNKLEIVVKELSTETNFNTSEIGNERELLDFATEVGFPSHGLILKNSKHNFSKIYKGIIDAKDLIKFYNELKLLSKTVWIETDMRANYNPTRMKTIQKATLKLIEKINSLCPKCKTPGFGICKSIRGLPCDLCGFATNSLLMNVAICQKCHLEQEYKFPHGKEKENPMYCDFCNP